MVCMETTLIIIYYGYTSYPIIWDHTKIHQLLSNVTFSAKQCKPRNDFSNFQKAWSIRLLCCVLRMYSSYSYDSYDRSNVDVWTKSYEVCNIVSIPYWKSIGKSCLKKWEKTFLGHEQNGNTHIVQSDLHLE